MTIKEAAELYIDIMVGNTRSADGCSRAIKIIQEEMAKDITGEEMFNWCKGYLHRELEDEA